MHADSSVLATVPKDSVEKDCLNVRKSEFIPFRVTGFAPTWKQVNDTMIKQDTILVTLLSILWNCIQLKLNDQIYILYF